MQTPGELRYSSDHEWVAVDGTRARIGITEYAQDALGDVVYVQVPELGATVAAGVPHSSNPTPASSASPTFEATSVSTSWRSRVELTASIVFVSSLRCRSRVSIRPTAYVQHVSTFDWLGKQKCSKVEIGRAAAEETIEQVERALDGAHMCAPSARAKRRTCCA